MANRKYKDTVFRMLYGNNKKELLELYNAVNDTAYDDPEAINKSGDSDTSVYYVL